MRQVDVVTRRLLRGLCEPVQREQDLTAASLLRKQNSEAPPRGKRTHLIDLAVEMSRRLQSILPHRIHGRQDGEPVSERQSGDERMCRQVPANRSIVTPTTSNGMRR